MPRTVVLLWGSDDGVTRFLLEAPKPFTRKNNTLSRLVCLPNEAPFSEMRQGDGSPDRVQEAGKKLFEQLHGHPAIAPAIAAALQQQLGGCSPICLRVQESPLADDLPWEALYGEDADGALAFFALDDRWPIVRVREVVERDTFPDYVLEPPLRITAVLSAAGSTETTRAPAEEQWNHLRATIEKHLKANNAVEVKVTVFVGEGNLLDTINNAQLSWVTAKLISNKSDLLDGIKDARPQILHFFCHGTADESPVLRIGSYTDWEDERDPSITIVARELPQNVDPDQNTWLVTLNCCESASRAADARSLASSLVAAGFPAALGMREAIDVQQAHLLCKHFYPKVMEMIRKIPINGPATEIEWAQALSATRSRFVPDHNGPPEKAAAASKGWTIPVLYTRTQPFLLKRIAPAPPGLSKEKQDIIDYIKTLQQQRAKIAEDNKNLTAAALAALLQPFDNQIQVKTQELL